MCSGGVAALRGVVEMCLFFFQAEDGIRDYKVTGVQTCALPIWPRRRPRGGAGELRGAGRRRAAERDLAGRRRRRARPRQRSPGQIGRASCRESVDLGGRRIIKKKKTYNGVWSVYA